MKNFKFLRYFACSAALIVATASIQTHAQPLSDEAFSEAMKKYLASDDGQKTLGSTVENYFRKKQQEAMKDEQSKAEAETENQFKNPVNIDVGNSPVRGPKTAPVTIIEFSDFQCPFCKRGTDTLHEVAKAYPDKVKIVFKNKPLPMHPEALPAAKAAYAAGKQGKFWEMHDALFDNQDKLGAPFYEAQAKKLGLNMDQFKKDSTSPETEKAIKDESALGEANGVQGTPNFFVNGVAVRGAYPVDYFKKIIDRWLAQK